MKATLFALVLAAACGGSSKTTQSPTNTAKSTDCGEGSGTMGPPSTGSAGSAQTATGDPSGSAGGGPTEDQGGELGSQRLPMGPDVPPCHGKPATTTAPSPVPPTEPPPAP